MINRTQKKCLLGSALMHGLLVLAALFGSAFFSGTKKEYLPVLEMIPSSAIITDGPTRGGGNPNVTTPPAAAKAAPPAPPVAVAPPPPTPKAALVTPKPPEHVALPEPPKKQAKSVAKPAEMEKPKTKETTKRNLALANVTTRDLKKAAADRKAAEREAAKKAAAVQKAAADRAARERADTVRDLIEGLSSGLSKGVAVEVPGPGGQAFVNYSNLVATIYQRQYKRALASAGDIARGDASVEVEIGIDRSGRVSEKRITRRSGNAALDKLAQRVLDSVTEIAPFPPGAPDEHRIFNLIFELKADRIAE